MALISCPECGKQISDRATACPDCGCPISTAPAAPVAAPVESNAEKVAKLLELAHRAKVGSDTKNAKHYYEQILLLEPGNWEAIFYTVYYEAMECKIMNIASAARSVANCLYGTFRAIADLEDLEAITPAINEVVFASLNAAQTFLASARSHYNDFPDADNAKADLDSRLEGIKMIFAEIESGLKRVFPKRKELIVQYQELYLDIVETIGEQFFGKYFVSTTERLKSEIAEADPLVGKRIELEERIKSLVTTQPLDLSGIIVFFSLTGLLSAASLLAVTGAFLFDAPGLGVMGFVLLGFSGLLIRGCVDIIKSGPSKREIKANLALKQQLEEELRDVEEKLNRRKNK